MTGNKLFRLIVISLELNALFEHLFFTNAIYIVHFLKFSGRINAAERRRRSAKRRKAPLSDLRNESVGIPENVVLFVRASTKEQKMKE